MNTSSKLKEDIGFAEPSSAITKGFSEASPTQFGHAKTWKPLQSSFKSETIKLKNSVLSESEFNF